jgi:hypothetical protein
MTVARRLGDNKRPRSKQGKPSKAEKTAAAAAAKAARAAKEAAERKRREASDFEALRVDDFSAGVSRTSDGEHDGQASREKKQEFSRRMGEFAQMLGGEPTPPENAEAIGAYVARLGEEERRFANRRVARSIAIAHAHEQLARRMFLAAAEKSLTGLIQPAGFALRKPSKPGKRTVCILLSDLHFGAEMSARDNPMAYRAEQESRRFGKIVYEVADYKPEHRADSELLVLLNGDVIDGDLQHDRRAGAPMAEQKIIFLRYLSAAIGFWSRLYKRVRVECQPGNHGRDIARHPGRATESKWDGIEFELYRVLEMMSAGLANVTFNIPFRAVSAVDLQGAKLLLTHGDTEVKMRHPDAGAAANARELHKINSTLIYGHVFDVAAFGHFHSGRVQHKAPTKMIFNPALIPPNGYARSEGYIDEVCGQQMWEAVEGHPVGDVRTIEVGAAEDRDGKLNAIVKPYRFPEAA